MTETIERVVPVLRIFDLEKAKEFYLGFALDWEHCYEPGMPVYMQVSRGDFLLHLTEHHGDGSPGAVVFVLMQGLDAFHREISAKAYSALRPGIEDQPWGMREMTATDPFGNRIRFSEKTA